jgi:hypothetical protein
MADIADELDDVLDVNRVKAVWAQFTQIMTGRALVRLYAAIAWTTFALADGAFVWWLGILATGAASISLVHARKEFLGQIMERLDERSPFAARVMRGCFPFPAENHYIELPGYLEGPAVLALAVTTGWFGAFEDPIFASAATIATATFGASLFSNLAAHPSYVMEQRPNRTLQAAMVVLTVVSSAFVWPNGGPNELRTIALVACAAMTAYVIQAIRALDALAAGLEISIANVEGRTLERVGDHLHTGLKNPSEALLDSLRRFEDQYERPEGASPLTVDELLPTTLEINRSSLFVATRISQWVEATRARQFLPGYTATELTRAVLRCWRDAERRHPHPVLEDAVAVESLTRIDRNLLTSCLSELVTNALAADAASLEIRFRPVQLTVEASGVELLVRCVCRTPVTAGRPDRGTLGLLADKLERYGGGLTVETVSFPSAGGLHDHTTRAWWPVDVTTGEHTARP